MAQPVFYQTFDGIGVDVTTYYPNVFTAGASVSPEYPSPPFLPGTKAFGSNGSEFLFVQASTAANLTDFVIIKCSDNVNPYLTAPITTTNVKSSVAQGIGSTGLVLRGSVTTIPAGAFYWACMKGQYIPATNSGGTNGLATNANGVPLFTSATAGILTSVTTNMSTLGAFQGIVCVNSLTVSIPSSIVPPAGDTKSNGFTVGPVVHLNNPRPFVSIVDTTGTASSNVFNIWSF